MKSRHTTLRSYNKNIQKYIDATPQETSPATRLWINKFLSGKPKDIKIFEIGSATGVDATYIESKGYQVQRSDASAGFVEWMNSHGQSAVLFDVFRDKYPDSPDIVFAKVVFLHFTRNEMSVVLNI
jgi:hypothetical protein